MLFSKKVCNLCEYKYARTMSLNQLYYMCSSLANKKNKEKMFIISAATILIEQQLFIASYYRQLSADIEILKIKPFLLAPKARTKKTCINFKIFNSVFWGNYLKCEAIHDFLILLRTAFNPVDFNRFRSHAGILVI